MSAILDAILYDKCFTHPGILTKLYDSFLLLLIEKKIFQSLKQERKCWIIENTSITPAILPVIFEDIMVIYAYKFIIKD